METIADWIEKLNDSELPIIIEGKKDDRALGCIRVKNRLYQLSKTPLFEVVEKIAKSHDEVIILTDFDKKGKELYGKLSRDLQKHGVKINRKYREWLQKNTKLSHIEGIDTYCRNNL